MGMDENTRAHMFEPFFTTKAAGHGTGLGLATAYGIVRQSGGAIAAISDVGRGTTITIHLPLVSVPAVDEIAAEVTERPSRGSETVLVVEDEPRVRKLIRDALAQKGYAVVEASRGKQAIEWLKAYPTPYTLPCWT